MWVRVRGTALATVLERLRLLLENVLRRAAHLRCLMLLPLPGTGGSVLISYGTLRAMGAGQVGVVREGLGRPEQTLSRLDLEQRLAASLPPSGLLPRYDFMISYRWDRGFDSQMAEVSHRRE